MAVSERIACMECGGDAFLIQALDPEMPVQVGDVLAYRCRECLERWDVVVDEDDLTGDDDEAPLG